MAEKLIKDKTITEEAKQEKKVLYKNWKLYASALGIVVIGTGTGLGIYYGVTNNSSERAIVLTEQEIVTAINGNNYQIASSTGSNANSITTQINPQFMQANLSDEVKTSFNVDSFSFNKITVAGTELQDDDLITAQKLEAQINYNYGNLTNQITNLTINVTATPSIGDQDIINAINGVTTYSIDSPLGDPATKIITGITENNANFIKAKLSGEIAKAFTSDLFKLDKVTVGNDNHELTNSDLGKIQTINTKINYSYNSSEIQTTDLTINITLSLPIDIGTLVTDENKNFTLTGVTASSTDDEIKDAIIKAVAVIAKDIVGEPLGSMITEDLIKNEIDINLDKNNPHQAATIEAKDSSIVITGTAEITFTLSA